LRITFNCGGEQQKISISQLSFYLWNPWPFSLPGWFLFGASGIVMELQCIAF
jgi:hypothetical protein